MRVLFIGGTGFISTAVSRLVVERGIELTLLNRGKTAAVAAGVEQVIADIHQPASVRAAKGIGCSLNLSKLFLV